MGENQNMSVRLYETLEMIGASEEMRRIHNEVPVHDILRQCFTFFKPSDRHRSYSIHTCGSYCEGTTTPGMESDIDNTLFFNEMCVHVDIREAGCGTSLVMVQEVDTQPGYFKLQLVLDRVPLTVYQLDVSRHIDTDRLGRICLKHVVLQREGVHVHGPANTSDLGDGLMHDTVIAFKCTRIPDRYREWIHRKRRHDWPPRQLLDKMANLSCFVVGVGYERSDERDIEWRLSFSLQERELMLSLNPVQHKCYILMKLIKKDIIHPFIGGVDAISSYHCKTCLFYAIENSPPDIWKQENLISCLFRCLNVLYEFVYHSNCPNYFITDSNMFDRLIFREKRQSILRLLLEILRAGHEALFYLRTDNLGDLLANRKMFDRTNKVVHRFIFHIIFIVDPLFFNFGILSLLHSQKTPGQNVQFLLQILDFLRATVCIKDHNEHQTQEAISYMTPWVHQRLAMSLASIALKINNDHSARLLLRRSDDHFRRGLATDLMNTRLMYVAVLYKLGKYEMCMEILEKVDVDFTRCVVSICSCRKLVSSDNVHFANKITDDNLSIKNTIYKTVASCISFLPSEINIVPLPLQYEMFRSQYTASGSRDEEKEKWFDWAVVDAKVFLFFMQYLVFSKLDLNANKEFAVEHLEWVINTDIFHQETAYNLLGWIYLQEHRLEEAVRCWGTSLAIRPDHNAAKYHVLDLLNNMHGALM